MLVFEYITFSESSKIALIKMGAILTISAKLANIDLLKIK